MFELYLGRKRRQLDRLNQKRQWYAQQLEQDRLTGKTGAKAAAQPVRLGPRAGRGAFRAQRRNGGLHEPT